MTKSESQGNGMENGLSGNSSSMGGSVSLPQALPPTTGGAVAWPRCETIKQNIFDLAEGRFCSVDYLGATNSFSRQRMMDVEFVLKQSLRLFAVQVSNGTVTKTVWDVLASKYKFQEDNLVNQFEDVCHALVGIILRDTELEGVASDSMDVVLRGSGFNSLEEHALFRYHRRLLKNYRRWCRWCGLKTFPWEEGSLVEGDEVGKMTHEIALWKMVWGESANLRHCPELLCYIYHWMMTSYVSVPTDRIPTYLETITPVIGDLWDEMNRPYGDHQLKVNYEDINELAWDGARMKRFFSEGIIWEGVLSTYVKGWTRNESFTKGETAHGKKTFVEHRSYLNFFRTWWRVYDWHIASLATLIYLNAYWREDVSAERADKYYGAAVLACIGSAFLRDVLDLLFTMVNPTPVLARVLQLFRSMQRPQWWFRIAAGAIRGAFVGAASYFAYTEGLTSPALYLSGSIGGAFLLWWFLTGLSFFIAPLMRSKPRWSSTHSFAGNKTHSAHEYRHMLQYSLFWIPVIILKIAVSYRVHCYGFVDLVEFLNHPDSSISFDFGPLRLTDTQSITTLITLGVPGVLVYTFDIMFYYAIFLALFSWGVGYSRGVGCVAEVEQAQRHFWMLPLQFDRTLSSSAGGSIVREHSRSSGWCCRRVARNSQKRTSYFQLHSRPIYCAPQLNIRTIQCTTIPREIPTDRCNNDILEEGGGGGGYKARKAINAAANKMCTGWWSKEVLGETNVAPTTIEAQFRRFGFVWNEVIESWREEDIIDNEERLKFQFNELPAINFATLADFPSGNATVDWEASEVRLPCWIYSDVLNNAVREAEAHQAKIDTLWTFQRDACRRHPFRSGYLLSALPSNRQGCGASAAATGRGIGSFLELGSEFCRLLFGVAGRERTDMQHLLRLSLLECFEALSFYVSRHFTCGAELVTVLSSLCQRVGSQPYLLAYMNFKGLQTLRTSLCSLLQHAQMTPSEQTASTVPQQFLSALNGIILPALLESSGRCVLSQDVFQQVFPELVDLVALIPQCKYRTPERPPSAALSDALTIPSSNEWGSDIEKLFPFDLTDDINPFDTDLDSCLRMFWRRSARIMGVRDSKPKTAVAQARLKYFSSSLFMEMPEAPTVARMVSMCTLTPYYQEDAMLDDEELHRKGPDGMTQIEFLRALNHQDWLNFLERVDPQGVLFECYRKEEESLQSLKGKALHAQGRNDSTAKKNMCNEKLLSRFIRDEMELWASMRTQTLYRTIRGVMYYEQALQILSWLELQDLKGARYHLSRDRNSLSLAQEKKLSWQAVPVPPDSPGRLSIFTDMYNRWVMRNQKKLWSIDPYTQAIASLKFQYVVTAQTLGDDLKSASSDGAAAIRVRALTELLQHYPGLRAACVETCTLPSSRKPVKCSTLFRWDEETQRLVRVYRVVLSLLEGPAHRRNPIVGEGKAENQNHAIIYTRGETLQAIDMNQELHLEEALKMRNITQEFARAQKIGIVGFREPPMSSPATTCSWVANWNQFNFCVFETRAFHIPLRVRLHYGHPDLIDRYFVQTMGGESKASAGICVSEDVYCGLNVMERGYSISQVDYVEAVKGWPNDLDQLVAFFKKCGAGSAEAQSFSRDSYRISRSMDFFNLLSMWATWPGWHIANILVLCSVWLYLYARVFLGVVATNISPLMRSQLEGWDAKDWNIMDQISIGLFIFLYVKFFAMIAVEEGLGRGWQHLLQHFRGLTICHFTFTIGTWTSAFDDTMLYGKARYQNAGRGIQFCHKGLIHMWKTYFFTHWQPAIELLILLSFHAFGQTLSPVNGWRTWFFWVVAGSWLFLPILYNPDGLCFSRLTNDIRLWQRWMRSHQTPDPNNSWANWWCSEMESRQRASFFNRLFIGLRNCKALVLSLCIFQYFVYKPEFDILEVLIAPAVVVLSVLAALTLTRRKEHFTFRTAALPKFLEQLKPVAQLISWILVISLITLVVSTTRLSPTQLIGGIAAEVTALWAIVHTLVECVGRLPFGIQLVQVPFIIETIRLCHMLMGYAMFSVPLALSLTRYISDASQWQRGYMWNSNVTSSFGASQLEVHNSIRKGTHTKSRTLP